MKASVRWLRELCPGLPDDAEMLAARLTAAGVEVEAVHAFGAGAQACRVARVVSARPHPSRSGLRLATVDGGGALQEVVCGAPNVPEPGGLVVLAPLGAHLPAKNLTIERRTIAGVPSEGMLCSEAELGLGDDADGILVLPQSAAGSLGMSLAAAIPASRDTILELGLTPNRADCLGHLGLAREAAALLEVPFQVRVPTQASDGGEISQDVAIAIEDSARCPHYGAAMLTGATIAASPPDVRWRLTALGLHPISNAVDVTNLVMLEFGHPMHAFDFDKVRGGRIVVRHAREGETLTTLDGVERELETDDLVICDGQGPIALAGVMGGRSSEITSSTSRILLESAYFDPRGVRRTARRHGLHTESSHRFERGVDWGDTLASLVRAGTLLAKLTGARPRGEPQVFEARALSRASVALRHERLRELLGVDVDHGEAHAILDRLGCVCRASQPGVEVWEVPSHRSDATREVDLIEEVARVRGYDAIPAQLPAIRPSRNQGPRDALARRARNAAVSMGLSEAITFAFVSPSDLEAVGAPAPVVTLRNPLREDLSVMRTSLLPGLLHVLARARRHGERAARLFSVGTVFAGSAKGEPVERLAFAAVLAGGRPAWLGKSEPVDVWDAKGLAEGLVLRLLHRKAVVREHANATVVREHANATVARGRASATVLREHTSPADLPSPRLHPRGAAWIEVDGVRIGVLGPLYPDTVDTFDLGEGVEVVDVDLDALTLLGVRRATFVPLPRFPASLRDIAVIVRDEVSAGDLERAVRNAAGDLAEDVTLFDRFVGGNIPAGHTSLALRVVYRAPDRTLTDAEVDLRHAHVIAEVEKQFGGRLRA